MFTCRLDPWATYVLPTPRNIYDHHFWNPCSEDVYQFKSPKPTRPKSLKVIRLKSKYLYQHQRTLKENLFFQINISIYILRFMNVMLEYLQVKQRLTVIMISQITSSLA